MKRLAVALLLLVVPTVSRADDILVAGTYYYKAHLEDIKAESVVIVHKSGRTLMPWGSLPLEYQRRYAAEHDAAIKGDAAKAQAEKLRAAGMETIGGTLISIVPNEGVLIRPTGSRYPALIRGYDAKGLADGDPIPPVVVIADGIYSYDSTGRGIPTTVHAYKFAPAPAN